MITKQSDIVSYLVVVLGGTADVVSWKKYPVNRTEEEFGEGRQK